MRVLRAEARNTLITTLRYPFEAIGGLVILYLLFLAIFMGSRYVSVAGTSLLGDDPSAWLLGFLYYFATISGLSGIPGTLEDEEKKGTATNLFMGSARPWVILSAKSLVTMVLGLCYVSVLYGLSTIILRTVIPVDPGALLVILFAYPGMIGLGLLCGGLSLLYKRIGNFLNLLNLGLLVLAIYPPAPLFSLRATPFTYGLIMLRKMASTSSSIGSLDLLGLLAVSACYYIVGVKGFASCERKAKMQGSIGFY